MNPPASDSISAGAIIDLLRDLNRKLGLTIIIVTHDVAIAARVDRTIAIRDGRTSTETVRRATPVSASDNAGNLTSLASAVIGLPGETHRESVLIDRVGRLQLPKEALELLPFNGRAEVRLVKDHVELWPLQEPANGNGAEQVATGEQAETTNHLREEVK
jgi:energy-coupling factor transporter ATP-binding protein EcfA2